jgi:hypothetical protein
VSLSRGRAHARTCLGAERLTWFRGRERGTYRPAGTPRGSGDSRPGSVNVKVEPLPTSLVTQIRPPCVWPAQGAAGAGTAAAGAVNNRVR